MLVRAGKVSNFMRYDQNTLPPTLQTRLIVIESGALRMLPEVLKQYFPGSVVQLVADENTFRAAGKAATEILDAARMKQAPPILMPAAPRPEPTRETAENIAAQCAAHAVPVAVGAGVINDLVKYASEMLKVPYLCAATAASVDGYTASGAALLDRGLKRTIPCSAPRAVIADLEVLKAAPPLMAAAGFADWAAKVTGGADWLIADALQIEPIEPEVWRLVQRNLQMRIEKEHTLENIFEGLAATGIAMQLYGDSRPASGMEHLCSHVWEMEHLGVNGEMVSHGFKVAIGILAAMRMFDFIIRTAPDDLRAMLRPIIPYDVRAAHIRQLLANGNYGEDAEKIALAKLHGDEELRGHRMAILARWDEIRDRLRQQLIPLPTLLELFRKMNCPTTPAEIGLSDNQYRHGIRIAQLIRARYTVLDMLEALGLLDEIISR